MGDRRWLVCLFITLCISRAAADTITLKDGTVIEGTILEENDTQLVVKLKYGKATYQRHEIKTIQKSAQAAAPAGDAAELRDVVLLKDGTEHRGLLVSDDRDIVFDLIASGKNVSKSLATRLTFKHAEVKDLRKLSDEQRALARKYLEQVETSAKEDQVNEQNVPLEPHEWTTKAGQKIPVKKVVLEHFVIESNVNDVFLRKCAYRLGKVFGAYKQHFGAARNSDKKVRVLLFGSMAEYYATIGGQLKNPAFYAPDLDLIAAGCDVDGYEKMIKESKARHAVLSSYIRQYKRDINEMRAQINSATGKLRDEIRKAGATGTVEASRAQEQLKTAQQQAQLELTALEKQANAAEDEISICNRRNEQAFSSYTKLMLSTLYHEGFHAFVDHFLFSEAQVKTVPRWLNEGLAQYFECARLEGDRFILGQEDTAKLNMLRKWNKEGGALSLEKILSGDAKDYLVQDFSNLEHSTKHYLHAWCAVWLLGERSRLTKENLHGYVDALSAGQKPIQALGLLSGLKNEELEELLRQKLKQNFGGPQGKEIKN